jgi:hypothetical protein
LITPLGDAVLSGSLSCVRPLLDRWQADGSQPCAKALAAAHGHVDVLRLLLGKWPSGDRGEALAFAMMLGHHACASLLVGARFGWTPHVVQTFGDLTDGDLRGLTNWFGRSRGVAGRDSREEVSLWEGVRAMVEGDGTPVAAIQMLARWVERESISVPPTDAEFWATMREGAANSGQVRLVLTGNGGP